MAAGVLSILIGARSARTEVRLLDSHLRVVNVSGTRQVLLKDIVGIMPDKSLRGRLSLRLSDTLIPLVIEASPRSGKACEALRSKTQEALAAR